MRYTAIILCAGKGSRMKSDVKKQYIMIEDKPVIWHTIDKFQKSKVDDIVLVTGKEEVAYCKQLVEESGFDKVFAIVEGGAERYDSVYAGLMACEGTDYVLIHDGARPLIALETIAKNIEEVSKCSACITGVPVKDTIKVVDGNGNVKATPDRRELYAIQTPQSFKYKLIFDAYNKMYKQSAEGITDDAMVLERYGEAKIKVVIGEYDNIKITTKEDLEIVEKKLKKV